MNSHHTQRKLDYSQLEIEKRTQLKSYFEDQLVSGQIEIGTRGPILEWGLAP